MCIYNLATTIRTNTITTTQKKRERSYGQIAPDASRSTSSPSFVACSSFFTKQQKRRVVDYKAQSFMRLASTTSLLVDVLVLVLLPLPLIFIFFLIFLVFVFFFFIFFFVFSSEIYRYNIFCIYKIS